MDETDPRVLIDEFLSNDAHEVLKAITLIKRLAREDPDTAIPLAWRALLHMDGRLVVGECVELYKLLLQLWGETETERHVLHEWDSMSEQARINLCYTSYFAEAMSTRLILQLFESSACTVHVRELLVRGLARTAKERGTETLIPAYLDRIGNYSDAPRQAKLDMFKQEMRNRFLSAPE